MHETRNQLWNNEAARREAFPVVGEKTFMAHAGVCTLPRVARQALENFADTGSRIAQEDDRIWAEIRLARQRAADLIGASESEIALLGPTSLGLSLVANGFPWAQGDEVVYYPDDYPANVYPWLALAERGVTPVPLQTDHLGEITWETVERVLTPSTRLVALASCHYFTGYRVDIDTIGRELHARDIFFCLDGIQTIGAWRTDVEHVDFLAADSHKWMLGPVGAGIVYVRESLQEFLRPALLGAWNVESPDFIAQSSIRYYPGARRYEPGALNIPGVLAMSASMQLLCDVGLDVVSARIAALANTLTDQLQSHGYELPASIRRAPDEARSGIVTVSHPSRDLNEVLRALNAANIQVSARSDRHGCPHIRFSPHFYNTEDELAHVFNVLDSL